MSKSTQTAILLFAMKALKSEGSWCGETHVQKSVFLCQELVAVPSNFRYVLYKHGPYSFEVAERLQGLIADDFVNVLSRPPYGPSLEVADTAIYLLSLMEDMRDVVDRVTFLAKKIGKRGVLDLERLATAVYVNNQNGDVSSINARADSLNSIKPHVSIGAAKAAFDEIASIEAEAKSLSFC